jgi:2,3,4,5-tetrahydropyridine-2-carboxylate N-succinyltransferase
MSLDELRETIERLCGMPEPPRTEGQTAVERLLSALERGELRAAEPDGPQWRVNAWVKRGILLAFRVGRNVAAELPPVFHFRDRDTFPTWSPNREERRVRIVPGGTTVRRGAHLGEGVVVMPPAFVNVGAFVDRDSMIDSHALVGSCAQVGRGVHLSAAAQLGGVLEPVGALPVVVEDGAFVGGGAGIYEGTRVGAGAVVGPGVILSRGVAILDLVHERRIAAGDDRPLAVPPGAVVVPGARPARGAFARAEGVMLQAPVIVKYRDDDTAAATLLEEALR